MKRWIRIILAIAVACAVTGGIIAYSLATRVDARQVAVDHCARYGKVVKFLAVQGYEGGYISFSCRWVPYGAAERPISVLY